MTTWELLYVAYKRTKYQGTKLLVAKSYGATKFEAHLASDWKRSVLIFLVEYERPEKLWMAVIILVIETITPICSTVCTTVPLRSLKRK